MDDIKISIEGCNTEVSMANNAAEDFAKEAKNSANLALEQANRAKEIVDNSTENIESAKNQAIENAKYSIEEYQTTVLANLENSAGNLKNDMTNSMLTILDSTKQQADTAKYYAEQEHGQSDVTQNDLWTLERKTLFPTFEIRDESNILNELKTQRASSFDKSKFEIVGTPAISDDGVASGFNTSNYIYGNTSDVVTQISSSNNWSITSKTNIKDLLSNIPIFGFGANNTPNNDYPIAFINTYGTLKLRIKPSGDAKVTELNWGNVLSQLSVNEYITVTISYKNGHYYCDIVKQNGTVLTHDFGSYNNTNFFGNYVKFTVFNADSGNTGSIDLKQFSITVDGKEVFSGNKTGIDVIKPDNYTVVGSPVISADGVASGFSNDNYIQFEMPSEISDFEAEMNFTPKSTDISSGYCIHASGSPFMIYISVANHNYNTINAILTNSGISVQYNLGTINASAHSLQDKLSVKYSLKNGTLSAQYKFNDGSYQNFPTTYTVDTISIKNYFILGYYSSKYVCDLNAFKIYVDGNLVYQPCLKIPYTQAKLNHKIVDAVYRDRVQDLFEQVGYNGYFTLGENDFTLPSNKWSDVIDCYENGINKWEQRVDRTLRQQGSCTADEEVTLLKPYKDTNYVLNVPYASKTETGFIPTISGDWIANGKVYLD